MSAETIFTCDGCGFKDSDKSWWKSVPTNLDSSSGNHVDLCPHCVLMMAVKLTEVLPRIKWDLERIKNNYNDFLKYYDVDYERSDDVRSRPFTSDSSYVMQMKSFGS